MHWTTWLGWAVILFIAIFLRYLLFSGGYHYLLRLRFRERLRERIFHYEVGKNAQVSTEIKRSAVVSLIFALIFMLLLGAWYAGYTRLFTAINGGWDWFWLFAGPLVFLATQETYYYWAHRWMHRPGVYERVHKWHHESIETTAWTAFSFHPLEALIQAVFIPVAAFLIPMHVFAFGLLLAFMTLSATINHGGIEIYPKSWAGSSGASLLIGASHHDVHHKRARKNFGLYLRCWDIWMGTEAEG